MAGLVPAIHVFSARPVSAADASTNWPLGVSSLGLISRRGLPKFSRKQSRSLVAFETAKALGEVSFIRYFGTIQLDQQYLFDWQSTKYSPTAAPS
jgi:hypothetical protein